MLRCDTSRRVVVERGRQQVCAARAVRTIGVLSALSCLSTARLLREGWDVDLADVLGRDARPSGTYAPSAVPARVDFGCLPKNAQSALTSRPSLRRQLCQHPLGLAPRDVGNLARRLFWGVYATSYRAAHRGVRAGMQPFLVLCRSGQPQSAVAVQSCERQVQPCLHVIAFTMVDYSSGCPPAHGVSFQPDGLRSQIQPTQPAEESRATARTLVLKPGTAARVLIAARRPASCSWDDSRRHLEPRQGELAKLEGHRRAVWSLAPPASHAAKRHVG